MFTAMLKSTAKKYFKRAMWLKESSRLSYSFLCFSLRFNLRFCLYFSVFFVCFNYSYAYASALPLLMGSVNSGSSSPKSSNVVPSLAPMLQKVLPAVVNISVRGELPPMRVPIVGRDMQRRNVEVSPKFEDLGSGVIVDAKNGYIVTNAHVVKDAQAITITLKDGRKLQAKVIGADAPSDVAVLQVEAHRLEQVSFGDSDKLRIGDFVSAIGSPFGLQQTVTSGVISGLERSNLGIEGYESFIQTDAPINMGNSGGALVDMQGELIGINTAIITPSPVGGSVGIGLALPSNMVRSVMEQLVKYGKVERGVLGVLAQDVTPALADAMHLPSAEGALVSQVLPNTPASEAGIKSKDVIISILDKPVRSAAHVRNIVSLQRVGSRIALKIWRDNKFINLSAVNIDPGKIKARKQAEEKQLLAGLELKSFNQLVDNEQIKGVQVLYVDSNSVAYSCGLREGDVILTAGNQPVSNIDDLKAAAAKNPKQLLLEVKRGMMGNIFVVLEV